MPPGDRPFLGDFVNGPGGTETGYGRDLFYLVFVAFFSRFKNTELYIARAVGGFKHQVFQFPEIAGEQLIEVVTELVFF